MNAFKTYYLDVFKNNYVNFEGRATRKQYWMFFFFFFIVVRVLNIFSAMMNNFIGTLIDIIYGLYALALLLPNLAIGARRLHDTNRSGWWQLLAIVPLIGYVIVLVFFALPSAEGQNRFDK